MLISFILALWIFRSILVFFYVKYEDKLFGILEHALNIFVTSVYIFETICQMTNFITFENDTNILTGAFIFLIQVSIVDYLIKGISDNKPRKPDEAIQMLKDLIPTCTRKHKNHFGRIHALIFEHRKTCSKADCDCKQIDYAHMKEDTRKIIQNDQVYTSENELPDLYRKGFFINALKLIAHEYASLFPTDDDLGIMIAEFYYYYFGNHYYAFEMLWPIIGRNPGIFIKQRIYCLKRNIMRGLKLNYSKLIDREKTITTIDYLSLYRKFLDKSDDLIDLTIEFWSMLLKERPTARELNQIGNNLFKLKQHILKIFNKINILTSNNFEFLIRYGLLMKSIMHDHESAEQIIKKLFNMRNLTNRYSENSRFCVFSSRSKVMFLLASFTETNDANVIQINTEFEQCLGYSYSEIIGRSITILMPNVVANIHAKLVQKFFQTMKAPTLSTALLNFVKDKNGLFIPCRTLVKIVPRLNNSIQAVCFMIKDIKILEYTNHKSHITINKPGTVICDSTNHIIGLSKEAVKILKFTKQNVADIMRNCALEELFSELSNSNIKEQLSKTEGIVFKYAIRNTEENLSENANDLSNNSHDENTVLLWARLVDQNYTEQDSIKILVLAKIHPKYAQLLSPNYENDYLYEVNSNDKTTDMLFQLKTQKSKIKSHNNEQQNLLDNESSRLLSYNEKSSTISVSSDSQSQYSIQNSEDVISHVNLQKVESQNKTPSSIKRLSYGIALALLGIISLISIFHISMN